MPWLLYYRLSSISRQASVNIAHTICEALRSVIRVPNRLVKDVDLLTKQHLDQLVRWNRDLPPVVDSCVHHLIERHAHNRPESSAVHSWDGHFTYAKLNELSSRVSQKLLSLGVGVECFVPLCFEKSSLAVVAMMGVFKAGGACVFLQSSHPQERIESIIHEIGGKVVLVSPSVASMFEGKIDHIVELTEANVMGFNGNASIHPLCARPSNAAIGLFTSGSTGKPKGII